jgi:hypothetical protein
MRRRSFVQGGIGALAAGGARAAALPVPAAPASRLIVAELFTSEGCSSCPPADALLTDLAGSRTEILLLAYHVTYWDGAGWRDPFSLEAATARQRWYARLLELDTIYTPQLVVGGRWDVIGSDRPNVLKALAGTRPGPVGMSLARQGAQVMITVDAGVDAGSVLLVGYDAQHRTAVGRGENGGRTLLETNVVRSVTPAGAWSGGGQRMILPLPAGEHLAALLQASDGTILGAARETA